MNDADTAYATAQEKIAQAANTGAVDLDFSDQEFHALDRLPPEIADLKGLQSLDLNHTQITDLTPLANLTALQALFLNKTQITDLAPLAGLVALDLLDLGSTSINDLGPLAGLTALQMLELENTQITDLAPLAGLRELKMLVLTNTQITDLAPLANLTALQALFFDATQITDLAPLAGMTEARTLVLAETQISDLAPLAGLTELQMLDLENTQITDLAPLAGMTAARALVLSDTQVTDLRPIAGLNKLGTSNSFGLRFHNTLATKHDARLAELSQIENDEERSRETLAYLRTLPPWPEPFIPAAPSDGSPPQPIGQVPTPPAQDPALPLIWGENGFDFFANSINTDPVTEAALADLRDLLDDLHRKGNQHDDLYRIAAELQERSAGAISDLNMVKLHLSYQRLRRLHQGRAARQISFDDETVSTMEAVFDVLPGVTLADTGVKVLIERQEAERATGLPAAQDEAAEKVLQDVQDPDAPFAVDVKDIAAEVLRPGAEDRLAATRRILSYNVVVNVLTFVSLQTIGGVIQGPVGNFVYDNGRDLLAYAATMGDDALFWAQSVMAKFRVEYELAMGIAREIAGANVARKPPAPRSK